jgi:hypothetical protein
VRERQNSDPIPPCCFYFTADSRWLTAASLAQVIKPGISGPPHTRADRPVRQLNVHLNIGDQFDWQHMKIVVFEGFLLPASCVQVLTKLPFLIEQADCDQRQCQIAGCLQVIPCEHSQAAGKNGRHSVIPNSSEK